MRPLRTREHAGRSAVGGLIALVLVTLAPGGVALAQDAANAPVQPKGMRLFPDTQQGVSGKPLATNEFMENQQRLLFLVEFDPARAGTVMDVAIVNVRSTGGQEQVIFSASDKIDKDGRLPIELKLPRNWPVGHYDVRLGISERLIARLPFRIEPLAPRHTPIKAQSDIAIVLVDGEGKQSIVAAPKAANRHLFFIIDTSGSNTSGATVTWTLTALTSSAGNNIVIGSSSVADWPLENTRLAFDVQLPRDWPTGKYKLEAKINSQLLNTLHFDIQP